MLGLLLAAAASAPPDAQHLDVARAAVAVQVALAQRSTKPTGCPCATAPGAPATPARLTIRGVVHEQGADGVYRPLTNSVSPPVIIRAPVGHTHTCSRCGTTWDHAANPGHNCPKCGTAQYTQDPAPRTVTTDPATYSLGGCANGSCGTAQSRFRSSAPRWFAFPRK